MFFYASKALGFALQPSSILVWCILGAFLATWRGNARATLLFAATGAALGLAALSPLANIASLVLEERFPRSDLDGAAIAGVIMIGGGEDARIAVQRHVHALTEGGERISEFVALARRLPNARLFFSGGSNSLISGGETEAQAVRAMIESMGVEPGRLNVEDRSRDTWENAVFSKTLVKPRAGERWLLVTSAWHMPRAMGVFRAAGFPVEAWPVDYRTAGWGDAAVPFNSESEGLRRLDVLAKEYGGLVIYWLTGRSSSLFPGPKR